MTRPISEKPVKRTFEWNKLTIAVEYEVGDERFGKPMTLAYGYIAGRYDRPGNWEDREYDFEPVDCYIGPDLTSPHIYRLNQLIDGRHDESKIMIGFHSQGEAAAAYITQMPPEMFGDIYPITIDSILAMPTTPKAAFESAPTTVKCIATESDASGLPKLLQFEVPITNGALRSVQGRDWLLDSVEQATKIANEMVDQGLQILIYESHPPVLKNPHTGGEEISTTTNPPVFEQRRAFVDRQRGKLVFEAAVLGTERSQVYARAIADGYEPNISIRAPYVCADKGECKQFKIPKGDHITFDVLQPFETPGITGSKFALALESFRNSKPQLKDPIDGGRHCQCPSGRRASCQGKCKSQKTIATEGVKIMDEKVLMALVKQAKSLSATLEQLLASVEEAGGTDEDMGKAAKMYRDGGNKGAGAGAGEGMEGKGSGDEGEKPMAGFESLAALPVEQRKKAANKLVTMVTQDENLSALQNSVTRARTSKAKWPLPEDAGSLGFESAHDLSNIEQYPLHKVQTAIQAAVTARGNLQAAATWLDRELGQIATESVKPKEEGDPAKPKDDQPPAKVGAESASGKPDPVVPKKEEPKKETKEGGEKKVGLEVFDGLYGSGNGHSQRWRGSMEKFLRGLVASAPQRQKRLMNMYMNKAKVATEAALDLAEKMYGVERLNKIHDLHESGKKIGKESIEVLTLGDYINREFVAIAIRILTYWQSAVTELVSTSINQPFSVGRTVNMGGIPFCQFLDVKSRERSQERNFDPRVRQKPNEPMRTITVDDRYDQYAAYYSSSAIYGTNELELFMQAAPLFENVPEDKIFELTAEKALEWTQKVAVEIMLSWMRYKPTTVTDETVADNNNVRAYSGSGYATLHGVTGGETVVCWVLPQKGAASAAAAALGPLVIPEETAFNDRGVISLDEQYPIEVDDINGTPQVPGKFNKNWDIVPLSNRPEHQNPTYAPHPSGLIGFTAESGITGNATFTSGYVVLGQYSYATNYIELDFTNGSSLERKVHANSIIEKIQDGVADVAEVRECDRPNAVWLNERVLNYLSVADHINGAQNTLSFAGVDPGLASDQPHAGFRFRQQQYMPSNDPILRSGHLGAVTVKGFTCAVKMGAPRIEGPVHITVTDENGVSQLTAQKGHYLEEVDFINTIPVVGADGNFAEYAPFGLFIKVPPPATNLPS